jgi:hypothetical protein
MKSVLRPRPQHALVVSFLFLLVFAQPALLAGQELTAETGTQPNVFAAASFPDFAPGLTAPASLNESVHPASSETLALNGLLPTANAGAVVPVAIVATPTPAEKAFTHPFWDRENKTLFAINGALAGADFFVTHRNLRQHGKELNPVARMFTGSTPALATNFALETGGVIGVSYLFHKTGHHKLERVTSYINLGASAFAVSYGLAHH